MNTLTNPRIGAAVLSAALIFGMAAPVAASAQSWERYGGGYGHGYGYGGDQVLTRCDSDGDRCAVFGCDDDGDDCGRISAWQRVERHRGWNWGRDAYESPETRCDSDGDRCASYRCDWSGERCTRTSSWWRNY